MKQGWEIKKLGEVCEIVGGSTPKTNEPSYWDGEHYWVTPAELDGAKYISSTSRTITDEGAKSAHLQLLPSGTVLLSSRAPIGKVAITTAPMYCNQGFKNLVCSVKLHNEFAYWFLYHHTEYLNSLGTGATFKEISKRVVEQIPIPIPSREEQERIVAELDCLSGVIEKKKQQLKELDALAQSIFYQMFGDPISNEKGWKVKNLGEVCDVCSSRRVFVDELVEDGVPFYRGTEIGQMAEGEIIIPTLYITLDHYERLKEETGIPQIGDLLLPSICNDGRIWLVSTDAPYYFKDGRVLWIKCAGKIDGQFLRYQLKNIFINNYNKIASGTTFAELKIFILRELKINIPPLTLQQEFAEKIEAIEKQKELIKQSIKETETLFNARMDYYFN